MTSGRCHPGRRATREDVPPGRMSGECRAAGRPGRRALRGDMSARLSTPSFKPAELVPVAWLPQKGGADPERQDAVTNRGGPKLGSCVYTHGPGWGGAGPGHDSR